MRTFITFLFYIFLPAYSFANIFTVEISEGVSMRFNIISESEHTVEVSGSTATASISRDVEGVVTIPSEVSYSDIVYSVVRISTYAFNGCSKLTTINIPDKITSLGSYAFQGCSALTSINIPESVVKIEDAVFRNCSNLSHITIGRNIMSIGNYTFDNCSALKGLVIEDSSSEITVGIGKVNGSYGGLFELTPIESLYIGRDISSKRALSPFWGNKTIKHVEIAGSVDSVSNYLFSECTGVEDVILPEKIKRIGDDAFYGCVNLKSINVPGNIMSIGSNAFRNCSMLMSFPLPSNLKAIEHGTFFNCTSLNSVEVPYKVQTIGDYAFQGCSGLKSIGISNMITTIGESAFKDCSSLERVYIPESVISHKASESCIIGNRAFKNCSNLKTFDTPSNVISIEDNTFEGCESLQSISVPESLACIGEYAFKNCTSLTSFEVYEVSTEYTNPDSCYLGKYAFNGCAALQSVKLPNSLTKIGENSFNSCKALSFVELPHSLLGIDKCAFSDCSSLNELFFPNGLKYIGESAFYNCTSLSLISLPETLEDIGPYSFSGCSKLSSLSIPGSVKNIEGYAFSSCKSLSEIIIEPGLKSIESRAFYSCSELKTIEIPEGVESIGESAFEYCSSLESVSLPSSLTSIGFQAFYASNSLANIYSRIQVPFNLPNAVFKKQAGSAVSAVLHVPYNKKNVYKTMSGWKDFTSIVEMSPAIGDFFKSTISYGSTEAETEFLVTNLNPMEVQIGREGCSAIEEDIVLSNCIIPSSVANTDGLVFTITGLGEQCFGNCQSITTIVLPRSINSIEKVFTECSQLNSVTVNWRNLSDVCVDEDNFTDISSDAILYVPAGTVERYAEHEVWGRFTQIIESGPISVGDISTRYGSKVNLPIYLKNDEEIAGLQFKLTLPNGVSVPENDEGLIATLTDRTEGMTVLGLKDPEDDNSYLFVLLSMDGLSISGQEGAIINIPLDIAPEMAIGNYETCIGDVQMATAAFETLTPVNSTSDLKIQDYMSADVNGDNTVDALDASLILQYVAHKFGDENTDFIKEAADTNNDNVIDALDASLVLQHAAKKIDLNEINTTK